MQASVPLPEREALCLRLSHAGLDCVEHVDTAGRETQHTGRERGDLLTDRAVSEHKTAVVSTGAHSRAKPSRKGLGDRDADKGWLQSALGPRASDVDDRKPLERDSSAAFSSILIRPRVVCSTMANRDVDGGKACQSLEHVGAVV